MKIGITTTVPSEIIFAAGHVPVDLNNIFVSDPEALWLVERAELAGYPRNCCAWVKGIYGTVTQRGGIDALLAVCEGDCSHTHALMETLQLHGVEVIPFAFPFDRDEAALRHEVDKLIHRLGTSWEEAENFRVKLHPVRQALKEVDRLTWEDNVVTSRENHRWLLSSSDFEGDTNNFKKQLDEFLCIARARNEEFSGKRLALVGVPPIFSDLFEMLEGLGARVVFNEVPRQFAMPFAAHNLVEQYLAYTYPYDIFTRLEDIEKAVSQRRIDGIIHYVQSFCFRGLHDMILRERFPELPILTLEGERPGPVDVRTQMRLETFVQMLRG